MLILSNCLTETPDEGSLKVAESLVSRIKAAVPETTVISYERRSRLTDIFLKLNKLLLSRELTGLLKEKQEPVLYLPFPTRALPMAARIFLLSHLCPEKVSVVLSMTRPHGPLSRLLLKRSRAHLFVLSRRTAEIYSQMVGEDRVTYLKTGVDTRRFHPVSPERAAELKRKYGLDPSRKVLLHVGHLKAGRNLARLMEIDSDCQILLVASTFTADSREEDLRKKLEQRGNITIIDRYLPDIEEIYQLSDAYFFPVAAAHNCIDVPLSCLEAAACGVPVITTDYGEMAEFVGKPGFFFLEMEEINELLDRALAQMGRPARESVMEYDWAKAARELRKNLG